MNPSMNSILYWKLAYFVFQRQDYNLSTSTSLMSSHWLLSKFFIKGLVDKSEGGKAFPWSLIHHVRSTGVVVQPWLKVKWGGFSQLLPERIFIFVLVVFKQSNSSYILYTTALILSLRGRNLLVPLPENQWSQKHSHNDVLHWPTFVPTVSKLQEVSRYCWNFNRHQAILEDTVGVLPGHTNGRERSVSMGRVLSHTD